MIVYHVLIGPPNLSSRVRRMYNILSTIDKGKMHHLLTSEFADGWVSYNPLDMLRNTRILRCVCV
jgi:hypothetical protein